MPTPYDEAVATLVRAGHDAFVAERQRLASALKAAGDRAGAAQLAKLTRPTLSAWVVNQLFWRDRPAFDALFETAQRLREGGIGGEAAAAHRHALAHLRVRAAALLAEAGKAASETTLGRAAETLAALAAAGSFDPDPPGALQRDRTTLGFAIPGLKLAPPAAPRPATREAATEAGADDAETAEGHDRDREREQERERERERERARQQAERDRIAQALQAAQRDRDAAEQAVARLTASLAEATAAAAAARAAVRDLEAESAALGRVTPSDRHDALE